jgi:hypothetical protein
MEGWRSVSRRWTGERTGIRPEHGKRIVLARQFIPRRPGREYAEQLVDSGIGSGGAVGQIGAH